MDITSFGRKKVGVFSLNILSWLLFLVLVFPTPAPCGIKEELKLRVTVVVNWNIKGNGVNEGYLEFKIRGKLKLNKEFSSTTHGRPAVLVYYKLHQATGNYQYWDKTTEKPPPKNCPELVSAYTGGGSVNITPLPSGPGDLIVNYIDSILKSFKVPRVAGPMPEALIDTYLFGSVKTQQTVRGKKREDQGETCVYKPAQKEISLPNLTIRFKIPEDGKMSGTRTWSSRAHISPHFQIGLSDLPPSMEKKSYAPEKDPEGNVHYKVSWTFDEQLPPETEIQSVSFNYPGENNEKRIVLALFRLEANSKISPPEWTKGGDANEPAAFVLGHPFKVKAVFQADQEVKKAEISAEEEVMEGDGGFGGIEKQTIDFKGGKGEAEFKIKQPQKSIGVNKVKWAWKGTDKTPGKVEAKMDLGQSEHKIYVVGGGPDGKVLPIDFNSYDYVVRKGCEWAAGTTGGRATFDRIWANFKNIPGPGNKILAYKHDKENYTTRALLMSGEGKCAAWSDFLFDTMACQGIQVEKVAVKPKAPFNWLIVHRQPGQNNPTPHRVFQNHALAAYQNHFYDPSYYISTPKVLMEYEFRTFIAYCEWESIQAEAAAESMIGSLLPKLLQPCYKAYEKGTMESFTNCLAEKSLGCVKNNPLECEVE